MIYRNLLQDDIVQKMMVLTKIWAWYSGKLAGALIVEKLGLAGNLLSGYLSHIVSIEIMFSAAFLAGSPAHNVLLVGVRGIRISVRQTINR